MNRYIMRVRFIIFSMVVIAPLFSTNLGMNYDKLLLIRDSRDSTITQKVKPDAIQNRKQKYTGRAMLYSGLIPGLGEYYTGAWKRGLIFAGVELAAWVTWSKFDKKGNNADDYFEIYADEHWEFSRWISNYYQWEGDTLYQSMFSMNEAAEDEDPLYVYDDIWNGSHSIEVSYTDYSSGSNQVKFLNTNTDEFKELFYEGFLFEENGIQYNFTNMSEEQIACYTGRSDCGPEAVADPNFHVIKDNTYYENVGKYNAFFSGWDDHDSIYVYINRGVEVAESPNKWTYRGLRTDANDYHQTATYMISTIMLNHVASMFDAILTAKQWNDKVHASVTASSSYNPNHKYGIGNIQFGLEIDW